MAEINGWRGLQNLAERKTGRIVVSVAERWRCCSKPVTGHLWYAANVIHFVAYAVMFSDWLSVHLQAVVLLQAQNLDRHDSTKFQGLLASY